MKFGLFGGARSKPGAVDGYAEGYREYVDTIVEAEKLGYYSNFLVEHHFSGLGQVSASLNVLTYLAARTTNIRLGPAVVVMPWHNPILVAEEAATLDLLSNGRLDFGVGRGYRYIEFEGFCIPIEEATERFEEAMAVIRKAWTTEGRFSWESKRWKYDNIIVEPEPVQRPHPPMWHAAGRPESLQYTAREGYNLFLDQFATFEVIYERLDVFKTAMKDAGRTYDPMGVAVARAILFADTADQREAIIQQRMKSTELMNAFGTSADGKHKSSMVSDANLRRAAEEGTLIGTPGEIVDRLMEMRERGVEYVLLTNANVDSLRRFAKEVMPLVS